MTEAEITRCNDVTNGMNILMVVSCLRNFDVNFIHNSSIDRKLFDILICDENSFARN